MSNINCIIVSGNIVKKAELKILENGINIVSFIINSSYSFKNKVGEMEKKSSFIPCRKYGKSEELERELQEGVFVVVQGRLKIDTYKKGEESYKVPYIRVEDIKIG